MQKSNKIYVAGHRGMVGAGIARSLAREGFSNLVTRTSAELDLREQAAVRAFFASEKPDYVFLAAARVGGIHANNSRPAEFIFDNLQIQNNIIDSAWRVGVKKLLFLGSSCIYPRLAPQPMTEECLLSGPLEPTNEWYAIAKISGIKMCQAYRRQYGFDAICAMPTNLYGQQDNFNLESSHVLPALLRRFHEAREANAPEVRIWGSGKALREFLNVDDLASACLLLMREYSGESHINVGSGTEISIMDLARACAVAVGYRGEISTDPSKPDGTPRKLMDSSKIFAMGFRPRLSLEQGLAETYAWYLANLEHIRK